MRIPAPRDVLMLIGSGSTAHRERIAVVELAKSEREVSLHHLPQFYAGLRSAVDFAGSDIDLEALLEFIDASQVKRGRSYDRPRSLLYCVLRP